MRARMAHAERPRTPAELLNRFPATPIERLFSTPGEIARCYSLDEPGSDAVAEAYDAATEHIAPFMTAITTSILTDLYAEAAHNSQRQFAFLARDGHILAAAARGLDPEFFQLCCVEMVVSRRISECVMLDYENTHDTVLPVGDSFRTNRAALHGSPDVPGSFQHFTNYCRSIGLRFGIPGSAVTVIDNAFRGSTQEMLAAVYPETDLSGHYAVFSASPDDRNANRKKGHLIHLPAEYWQGGPVKFVPDDERLTFLSNNVFFITEQLICGPAASAHRMTAAGPERTGPEPRLPPDCTHEIDYRYRDSSVMAAVRAGILLATAHYAQEVAASGATAVFNVDEACAPFTRHMRSWLLKRAGCPPELAVIFGSLGARPAAYRIDTVRPRTA